MGGDRQIVETNLRLIAAQAAKLADDVRDGRLWPGDLQAGLAVITKTMRDLDNAR